MLFVLNLCPMTTNAKSMSAAYVDTIRRLRGLLQEKKITPTKVADLMGVDLSEVSRWLNLKVEMKISSLFRLCEVCDIDTSALFVAAKLEKKRKAA